MRRLSLCALAACGGGGDPRPVPVPAPVAVPVSAPVSAPVTLDAGAVADARDDDLPGRYAVLVIRDLDGHHRGQFVSIYTEARLTLELADDLGATLCYAHEELSTIDSDAFSKRSELTEQHGYRGTYAIDGDAAALALTFDDTVCPTIHESAYADDRPTTLALTCARGDADGHPALRCEVDGAASAYYPLMIRELAPSTIVLGPDPGLSLRLQGKPQGGTMGGEDPRYEIRRGLAPIPRFDPEP